MKIPQIMQKILKLSTFLFLSLLITITCLAQEEEDAEPEKTPITLIGVQGGLHIPGADLKDRFGLNGHAGISLRYKTANNFLWGLEANILFGGKIQDTTVIQNLVATDGSIIGTDGLPAGLTFLERGFFLGANLGKLFPTQPSKNLNTGFFVLLGGGFLLHKIRIEDDFDTTPQLKGEYVKGYDRLTSGPVLQQFVGFMGLSRNRRANYYIGIELLEGFTQSRRSFNFDTRSADTDQRLDLLVGLKMGWMLPLYGKSDGTRYYTD